MCEGAFTLRDEFLEALASVRFGLKKTANMCMISLCTCG